jgi:fido (protein-threonine AMPylation protein)
LVGLPSVEELLEADWFDQAKAPEVLAIADAATIASRETFGPFNDEEESQFFAAEGLSPEETWERIAEKVADAGASVVALALADEPLTPRLVADVHAHVFEGLFPEEGGRFRTKDTGASYSILVGTRARPEERRQVGTGGRSLAKRVRKICEEFNEAVDYAFDKPEPRFVEDLIRPGVKVYCKLLSAHPFSDGNGRVCYLVLQYALVRIGLVAVALTDSAAHQWALGVALRPDSKQTYAQMERLIADTIGDARVG